MSLSEAQVQAALKALVDPNTGKDFISTRSAKNIKLSGADVSLDIELGYPGKSQFDPIRRQVLAKLRALPGAGNVSVGVTSKVVSHAVQRGVKLVPGIKNIIAVASGKGGVGKSTTAANLALALAAEGASVGMLDADIYGPSQPTMLGISGRPESKDGKGLEPMEGHGIQAISIGFLIDVDTPMVWRGPMVTQALEQLLKETRWRSRPRAPASACWMRISMAHPSRRCSASAGGRSPRTARASSRWKATASRRSRSASSSTWTRRWSGAGRW